MVLMYEDMAKRERDMQINPLEMMVLDAISNDYEEIGEIAKDVTRFAREENVELTQEQILMALRHLVELGLAAGFLPNENRKLEVVEPIQWDSLSDYWFKVSASGKALVLEMEGR